MIEFDKYYRRNAVLKKAQMVSPPIISLPDTGLPFWTMLHYAVSDEAVVGMDKSNPTVRALTKSDTVGVKFARVNPELVPKVLIQKNVRYNETISKYMRTVPGWARVDQQTSIASYKENILVTNFGLLTTGITVKDTPIAKYAYFVMFWKTVVQNLVTEIASTRIIDKGKTKYKNPRNHMIMIPAPDLVPSLKLMKLYTESPGDITAVKKLGNENRLLIGEIWKWLSGVESVFSAISEEDSKYINFLFTRQSSATLLNMYVLRNMAANPSRVKSKDKVTEFVTGQSIEAYTLENLRKAFLVMLTNVQNKIDAGIISEVLSEEELDGNGQAGVDEQNARELEASILNDEEEDAPSEKDITKQFLADTAETADDIAAVFGNRDRSKNRHQQQAKSTDTKPKSDELTDIFTEEPEDDIESIMRDTLDSLDELNDEAEEKDVVDEPDDSFDAPVEEDVDAAFKDTEYKPYTETSQDPEELFLSQVQSEVLAGRISLAEQRRFEAIVKKYRTTIKNPYGGEGTLADAANIDPKDLLIDEHNKLADKVPGVFDETFLESSHDKIHRQYNSKILKKDILSTSLSLMKAGYAIDNYSVDVHNDVVDSYEIHTVRLVPIRGQPSTIKFRVPVVTPNGTFKAGGNINRMRVQRADIPIRKVKPGMVALTSYHSKMWVQRNQLVAFNYEKWVEKTITNAATDPENLRIHDVSYGNVFNNDLQAPVTYSTISRYFASFRIGKLQFMWDAKKSKQFFGEEVMDVASRYADEQVLCGKGENSYIWMDNSGNLYEAPLKEKANAIPLGSLFDLIGVDPFKIPVQSADLKIFSKSIPIGIVLSFWIGLGNLLKTLGAKYRRVRGRTLLNLQPNEFYIKFKNESLVFDRNDKVTTLVMSGWNEYHAFIKHYSSTDFDHEDTFNRFFYETKIEGRFETELRIIRELWVDHITAGELVRLNEPTDMVMLLLSAVKKLTYDKHPDPMDGLFQRDRGYERVPGFVYDNLVRSVRGHRNRRFMKDAVIDLPPEKVWYDILKDQTTGIAEFSNPIHSLKEQEVVVFRGAGGRSQQSMMAYDRKAHRSNVGRDSEATVDSGDVATALYTTANPNYDSVRGTIRYTDKPNENRSRSFGTSQLMAAAAEYDDPNRRNFISIQNSRTTNSIGSTPLPVRTGYERVLGYRTDDLYATISRQPGKVIAKTNKVIIVQYEDGETQEIEIGLRYGEWSGKTMPHDVVTDLNVGDTFEKDTPIAWGKNFFVKDILTGGLLYKPGVLARVILVDDEDTWEDSSAIHANFAKKLVTQRVDKRDILVEANQEIRNLLPIGTVTTNESILCTIYNPSEGNKDLFSQDSLDSLKDFNSNSPLAKANGVITDIDVYYTGQVEDMSETLQDIVEASNARLYKLNKSLKKPALDGSVQVGTRFSGSVLNVDNVLARVRILTSEEMDMGSKIVIAHQMKSVVGRKIVTRLETEAGEPIDIKFSNTSFSNRIVDSGNQIGTTGVLCVAATKAVIDAYRGRKK